MRAGSNVVNQADILSIFSVTPELYQNHGLFCRALQEHFRSFDLFNDPGFGKIFLDRVRPLSILLCVPRISFQLKNFKTDGLLYPLPLLHQQLQPRNSYSESVQTE